MHLLSKLLGTTQPNANTGTPGAQILGITCNGFDGNIDELVRKTREAIQGLFDTNKITAGVPVLLKDIYDGDRQIWTPSIAFFVGNEVNEVCREHNTPMAIFVTDQDKFRTVQSSDPSVPTNSWFSADGTLLKNEQSTATDTRGATSQSRQQTASASQG